MSDLSLVVARETSSHQTRVITAGFWIQRRSEMVSYANHSLDCSWAAIRVQYDSYMRGFNAYSRPDRPPLTSLYIYLLIALSCFLGTEGNLPARSQKHNYQRKRQDLYLRSCAPLYSRWPRSWQTRRALFQQTNHSQAQALQSTT